MTGRRISTAAASRLYGIPARTIRRWHAEGRITGPEVDKGRHLWLQSEIDQLAQLRGTSRLPTSR
ncbi:MerR family transcriptional regulator [Acrocarpospora catenulata]|uniref:MerR family transcriptional regulator n=1 Tax=Acrocarpospora catenulata TaxID=2836182 RepID=UPI001BD96BA3|nr:MerR family transcriptional regulator [Acrocarpospora catenulata]